MGVSLKKSEGISLRKEENNLSTEGGAWKFNAIGAPHETDRFALLFKKYIN